MEVESVSGQSMAARSRIRAFAIWMLSLRSMFADTGLRKCAADDLGAAEELM
jgi:hypothetical protein